MDSKFVVMQPVSEGSGKEHSYIIMLKFQIMYGFDYNDIYRHLKRVNEHVSHASI